MTVKEIYDAGFGSNYETFMNGIESMINNIKKQYVVFDIETTGFTYQECEIIEIGAVKIKNGQIIDRYQSFIKPEKPIPYTITNITNITNEDVESSGNVKEILSEFINFIGIDSILVGQNSTKFDIPFLAYHATKCGLELPIIELPFDTMEISKQQFPFEKKHNLKILCERYNVEYDSNAHHRADYDAEITANIFLKQLKTTDIVSNVSEISEHEIKFLDNLSTDFKFKYPCSITASAIISAFASIKNT